MFEKKFPGVAGCPRREGSGRQLQVGCSEGETSPSYHKIQGGIPMKNLIKVCGILLLGIMFTSCVDYVQSITYKDGKYHLYYKVTLSKMLFELSDDDADDMFEEFEEDVIENLPDNIEYKSVYTDLEIGAEFSFDINPRTKDEDERDLLPKVSGKKCYIPFLLGESNSISDSFDAGDSDGEAITQAILSSAKCRVLIGKNVIPDIKKAYFDGRTRIYSIPVYDYGDAYCLEIPFIIVLDNYNYITDKIVIFKG